MLSFGANNHGQLGHGDLKAQTAPTVVEVLQGVSVVAVACGAEFTAAVTGNVSHDDDSLTKTNIMQLLLTYLINSLIIIN